MFAKATAAVLLMLSTAATGQGLSPADIDKLPEIAPTLVESYGKAAQQFGELRLDALPQHDPEVALPEGTQRVVVQLQVMPTAPRGAA